MVTQVTQDCPDNQEKWVMSEVQGPLEETELPEQWACVGQLVVQDLGDLQDPLDPLVHKEQLDLQDQKDLLDRWEVKELAVQVGPKDRMVLQGQTESKDLKVPLGLWVSQVWMG